MNKFLQPEGAPVTSERKQMGFDTDNKIEVQTKTIKASEINVADLAVISNGTVIMKVPTELDSSLQVDGSATFNAGINFGTNTITNYPNPMNIPGTTYVGGSASGTGNMDLFGTLRVHTPANRIDNADAWTLQVLSGINQVLIRYDLRVSNIFFYENSGNGIHEYTGVEVYLADSAGTNSFKVKNSDGYTGFQAPSDGGIRLSVQGTPPTAVEGAIYYDSTLHGLKYYNGSNWATVIGTA